jgi:signal transduction histidine kinase
MVFHFLVWAPVLFSPVTLAQTPAEKRPSIRVVVDNSYAPYVFRSDDGELNGILVDQWKLWEKKTGIKVDMEAANWNEALRRMRAGEFDVIDCIVETPERRLYLDFTSSYATIEASIFFRSEVSGITDLASLKGFPVGVKEGDQHIDTLKANGITTLILFQNNDEIIEAAKKRQINVFVVDAPSALYLLNKSGIAADFRHSNPIFRDELRRAVRTGNAHTLSMVSDGFAAIDSRELKQIQEKWFGQTVNVYGRYLMYAAYTAAVAGLLLAGLIVWNRMLSRRILQRTAALCASEMRFRQIAEQLRALGARLETVREDERTRVSREIHDELGQALTAIKLEFSSLLLELPPSPGRVGHRSHSILRLVDEAIHSIRRIAADLRPGILDDLGLPAAVEWVAEEFQARTGIHAQVSLPDEELVMDREHVTALFRILQETLTNVGRHSKATQVGVRLDRNLHDLLLEIWDNGIGITEEQLSSPTSLGILGVKERALLLGGEVTIIGTPGAGTRVVVRIPQAVRQPGGLSDQGSHQ